MEVEEVLLERAGNRRLERRLKEEGREVSAAIARDGRRRRRTLPLAERPVNQMVIPFWVRSSLRSSALTEPVVRADQLLPLPPQSPSRAPRTHQGGRRCWWTYLRV